jgi:uncharacterized protein (DUF433 family)
VASCPDLVTRWVPLLVACDRPLPDIRSHAAPTHGLSRSHAAAPRVTWGCHTARGCAAPAYHRPMSYARITTDPDVMGGIPCIRGLRIPVATVVAMVADRMTIDEIVTELPDLTPEDVAEALRYAAEAVRERELPLRPTA